MDDLQTEKEQLEEMRAWWAAYGKVVIAGIVIGIGSLVGFNQYKANILEAQLAASERFETLVGHVVDGDLEDADVDVGSPALPWGCDSWATGSFSIPAKHYPRHDLSGHTVVRPFFKG